MVMGTVAPVIRKVALVLTALFAVGGLLFGLGYAFEDLPIGSALLITAAIVVPLAGLTVLAVLKPDIAPVVLTIGVGLFAAYAVFDVFVEFADAPDIPLIALVLALPVAVMGQRHDLWAGALLLVLAAVPFLQIVVRMFSEAAVDRPGLGVLLGGSTGVVVIPLAVLGILFLVAWGLGRQTPVTDQGGVQPPARQTQLH